MDPPDTSTNNIGDVDMVLLSFANWLTDLRNISQSTSRTMTAEMAMVSNKITRSQTDLKEFKHQSASCQQQMQHNIAEIKEILTRTCGILTQTDKDRSELEQKLTSNFQGLRQILSHKQSEIDTLKKNYEESNNDLRGKIRLLQQDLVDTRRKLEDAKSRNSRMAEEHSRDFSELEKSISLLKDEYQHSQELHKQRLDTLQKDTSRVRGDVGQVTMEIKVWQRSVESRQQEMQRKIWELDHQPVALPGSNFMANGTLLHPPPININNESIAHQQQQNYFTNQQHQQILSQQQHQQLHHQQFVQHTNLPQSSFGGNNVNGIHPHTNNIVTNVNTNNPTVYANSTNNQQNASNNFINGNSNTGQSSNNLNQEESDSINNNNLNLNNNHNTNNNQSSSRPGLNNNNINNVLYAPGYNMEGGTTNSIQITPGVHALVTN